jgi:hypothetical protein
MGPESGSHKVTITRTGGTCEALVAAGRQIANQARSRGGFQSNRLNERLSDILTGRFPLSVSAPHVVPCQPPMVSRKMGHGTDHLTKILRVLAFMRHTGTASTVKSPCSHRRT